MNILITGATGFIGAKITTDLINQGHQVTCCVRNVRLASRIFPKASVIPCDFSKDNRQDVWLPRLKDIDVVINCAGILQNPNPKLIWQVHYHTPKALFDACTKAGVKKVIQLSALGVDSANPDFAKSKLAADEYLLTLPIKHFVIRPSLVYGPGSYGGTSLFRGLAGLPMTLLPGKGQQAFQPIHIEDLSKAILFLISTDSLPSQILNAVSEEHVGLRQILPTLRAWLGFKTAKMIHVPLGLIATLAKCGDWLPRSSINTTSFAMLTQQNVTSAAETKKFAQTIGFKPQDFVLGVYSQPSSIQDRWHARLYFLKPLLQLSIAFIWLFSALCSVFFFPKTHSYQLLAEIGVPSVWQPIFLYGASGLDALMGLAVLFRFKVQLMGCLQILLILLYTLIITWKLPGLWLQPFAPIAKNIPLVVAILVYMALETER